MPEIGGRHRIPKAGEEWPLVEPLLERLRAEPVDLAVQLHGGGRWSNPFLRALHPRLAIGSCTPDAAPLDRCTPYQLFQPEVGRMLEVVELVGARAADPVPHLVVTGSDRTAAADLLGEDPRPLVVLHPGGSDGRRHWPVERLAAVGRALEERGARVWMLEAELPFPTLVGLLDRAVLLVGNDSGPRHLADAVGTATVAVYWSGNLVNAGPVLRTRHHVHVSWRTRCPLCGANGWRGTYPDRPDADDGCDHDTPWVADVPLAEVLESALTLYGTERSGGSREKQPSAPPGRTSPVGPLR